MQKFKKLSLVLATILAFGCANNLNDSDKKNLIFSHYSQLGYTISPFEIKENISEVKITGNGKTYKEKVFISNGILSFGGLIEDNGVAPSATPSPSVSPTVSPSATTRGDIKSPDDFIYDMDVVLKKIKQNNGVYFSLVKENVDPSRMDSRVGFEIAPEGAKLKITFSRLDALNGKKVWLIMTSAQQELTTEQKSIGMELASNKFPAFTTTISGGKAEFLIPELPVEGENKNMDSFAGVVEGKRFIFFNFRKEKS